MIRAFLLEDEPPARERLRRFVASHPEIEVVGEADSVSAARRGLADTTCDLLFADIELGDGTSMQLFAESPPPCPVVFCTAFDEYVLEALGWNGIDYVLKPLREARVHAAIDKYLALRRQMLGDGLLGDGLASARVGTAVQAFARGDRVRHRRRLLVKRRHEVVAVPVEAIAYATTEHKLALVVLRDGERHLVDASLNTLERELDPAVFFRASRQYLVHIDAIEGFSAAGKGRLEVRVDPQPGRPVLVSQPNAHAFRTWLAGADT